MSVSRFYYSESCFDFHSTNATSCYFKTAVDACSQMSTRLKSNLPLCYSANYAVLSFRDFGLLLCFLFWCRWFLLVIFSHFLQFFSPVEHIVHVIDVGLPFDHPQVLTASIPFCVLDIRVIILEPFLQTAATVETNCRVPVSRVKKSCFCEIFNWLSNLGRPIVIEKRFHSFKFANVLWVGWISQCWFSFFDVHSGNLNEISTSVL